jgi:DNA-binding winged helix-turn-helix (wHTH) protein
LHEVNIVQMTYDFGDFVVDPQRRVLARRSGEAVAIGDKAFDALVHLIRHPGHAVSRASLVAALWPRAEAADNNLSQVIRALRFALGDTASPHRYVATVQRRGYQFVADVLPGATQERPAPPPQAPRVDLQVATTTESRVDVPRYASNWRRGAFALVMLGCAIALVPIFSPSVAPPPASTTDVPDRIVPTPGSAWPLPPVVACQREPSGSVSPRCARLLAGAKERTRRWKLGAQST